MMAFCTGCGASVSEGDAFCQKCGGSMQPSAQSQSPTSVAATVAQPTAPNNAAAKGVNAACPNCATFKRERKSLLSNIGRGVIALGFLPAVIGAYQYVTFDNKDFLERAAYQMAGADPRTDAAMLIGLGVVVMVIGLAIAAASSLGGVKVCTNCGYKFKRGE